MLLTTLTPYFRNILCCIALAQSSLFCVASPAQTDEKSAPAAVTTSLKLENVCKHSSGLFTQLDSRGAFLPNKLWQRNYPMLILDVDGAVQAINSRQIMLQAEDEVSQAQENVDSATPDDAGPLKKKLEIAKAAQAKAIKHETQLLTHLYWREPGADPDLKPLANPSILPTIYTTEKVLVLICGSSFGDGSDMTETSVVVNGPDTGTTESLAQLASKAGVKEHATMDRLYILDPSKVPNNSITRVLFTLKTSGLSDSLATVLLERHKVVHYVAGGGVLVTRATPVSFSVASVPAVVTTTTTVASSTLTNGVVSATTSNATTTTAAATASYVLAQRGSNLQINSVAGFTVYPFGRDTFPYTGRHGSVRVYGSRSLAGSAGVFLGTSVNTLGNFTVAPNLELIPGIQVFAGVSWWSKTILASGITPCTGFGSSSSFQTAPSSSKTESATSAGTTGAVTTNTVTTTTTSTTSGCANGDKATIYSGTAAPTQSSFKPAFAFGVLLNTNLFKAIGGLMK